MRSVRRLILIIDDFKAADVVAIITLICATFLKLSGVDGTVSAIMLMVVGYYFGKQQFKKKEFHTTD